METQLYNRKYFLMKTTTVNRKWKFLSAAGLHQYWDPPTNEESYTWPTIKIEMILHHEISKQLQAKIYLHWPKTVDFYMLG